MSKEEEAMRALKEEAREGLEGPLAEGATQLVFGKGNPDTRALFIGEAPGAEEDKQGVPFVGRAGEELDRLLESIGLTLNDVYIANVLKYRPPDNRDPRKDEIKRHAPFLVEQIKIIQPDVIVTLGNFATKFVLADFDPDSMDEIAGISNLHGDPRPKKIDNLSFTVLPMYHPAAMLYNPDLRETLEEDFQTLKGLLNQRTLGS